MRAEETYKHKMMKENDLFRRNIRWNYFLKRKAQVLFELLGDGGGTICMGTKRSKANN